MYKKILIVDHVHESLAVRLHEAGFICETNKELTHDSFVQMADEYVGLIIRNRFPVDKQVVDAKPSLKFIVRIGSGVEHIDVSYCQKSGISVLSTPEGNAHAVAEHCTALLFATLRHLATANQEVRNGQWLRQKNMGREMESLTVGIIGYGNTGKAFANMLHAFGTTILVYDKFKKNIADTIIKEVSLAELLQQSDVISLHINYLPENHHFINRKQLEQCQRFPIFLNTSRGLAVDTEALIWALNNHHLSFACLDVLEFEDVHLQIPHKEQWNKTLTELSSMENVLLTPHIAGQTYESAKRHADIAFHKIMKLKIR